MIELLVVISIIALLIGMLLPALGAARSAASAIACGSNMRAIGQGVATYASENGDHLPPSYLYIDPSSGKIDPDDQAFGVQGLRYLHWSSLIFEDSVTGSEKFSCPAMTYGGLPRTNPGSEHVIPDLGDNGNRSDNQADKQVPWVAYGTNAALVPRNKFKGAPAGGAYDHWVKAGVINNASRTILAAEFLDAPKAFLLQGARGLEIKSHRPINPFYVGGNLEGNPYNGTGFGPQFSYHKSATRNSFSGEYTEQELDLAQRKNEDGSPNENTLVATGGGLNRRGIGFHHNGAVNFVYADGHVERKDALTTFNEREWGDRFYSLNLNLSGFLSGEAAAAKLKYMDVKDAK